MTAYINAIGLFGTLLTTIGFIQGNVPGQAVPEGASVRIKGKFSLVRSQLQSSILRSLVTNTLTVGLEELGDTDANLVSLH
jgi:hypothetical protein